METLSLSSKHTIFCFRESNFLISSPNSFLKCLISDTFLKEFPLFKAHGLMLFKTQNKNMAPISFPIVPEETLKSEKI